MMSIDLSKKFTPHVQIVTGGMDVIVTELLRYHMPLLYATTYLFIMRNLNQRIFITYTVQCKIYIYRFTFNYFSDQYNM